MKVQTILALLVLLGIHVTFLYPLLENEFCISPYYTLFGILFLVLTCIGYLFLFKKNTDTRPIDLLTPIYVIVGAVATFSINTELGFGPVIAASSIGLIASFIPTFIKHPSAKDIPAAMYCGAFVGMSSTLLFSNYLYLLLAATISGVLLVLTKDVLNGYGGKLGTIAFGGVVPVILIIFYLC